MWTDFTDSKNGDSFALVFDRVTAARIIRDDDLGPKQKKIEGQILQLEKMKELDDAAKKTHQPPNLKTTLLLFVPRL